MLFNQDPQQHEKQQALLTAYEHLRQAGERVTAESVMALVQGKGITQQEVHSFITKLKRGRAL